MSVRGVTNRIPSNLNALDPSVRSSEHESSLHEKSSIPAALPIGNPAPLTAGTGRNAATAKKEAKRFQAQLEEAFADQTNSSDAASSKAGRYSQKIGFLKGARDLRELHLQAARAVFGHNATHREDLAKRLETLSKYSTELSRTCASIESRTGKENSNSAGGASDVKELRDQARKLINEIQQTTDGLSNLLAYAASAEGQQLGAKVKTTSKLAQEVSNRLHKSEVKPGESQDKLHNDVQVLLKAAHALDKSARTSINLGRAVLGKNRQPQVRLGGCQLVSPQQKARMTRAKNRLTQRFKGNINELGRRLVEVRDHPHATSNRQNLLKGVKKSPLSLPQLFGVNSFLSKSPMDSWARDIKRGQGVVRTANSYPAYPIRSPRRSTLDPIITQRMSGAAEPATGVVSLGQAGIGTQATGKTESGDARVSTVSAQAQLSQLGTPSTSKTQGKQKLVIRDANSTQLTASEADEFAQAANKLFESLPSMPDLKNYDLTDEKDARRFLGDLQNAGQQRLNQADQLPHSSKFFYRTEETPAGVEGSIPAPKTAYATVRPGVEVPTEAAGSTHNNHNFPGENPVQGHAGVSHGQQPQGGNGALNSGDPFQALANMLPAEPKLEDHQNNPMGYNIALQSYLAQVQYVSQAAQQLMNVFTNMNETVSKATEQGTKGALF